MRVIKVVRQQQWISEETQGCPDVGADARRHRREIFRQFRLQERMRGQGHVDAPVSVAGVIEQHPRQGHFLSRVALP